ncbi:MAG: ATPase [Microgenomates group bacterium GW2011_GWC2_45_8]|nr:MAG: ATPase [Microgenomates group bacterium GW2011_GWC2_45_8]
MSQTQRLFEEYMQFGGYPKVILATTTDEKKIEIEEIYRSYTQDFYISKNQMFFLPFFDFSPLKSGN